jgi:hypothetical protein
MLSYILYLFDLYFSTLKHPNEVNQISTKYLSDISAWLEINITSIRSIETLRCTAYVLKRRKNLFVQSGSQNFGRNHQKVMH